MLALQSTRPEALAGSSYSPATADVAPELVRAFEAACDDPSPGATARLRDLTAAFVERLKADEWPPEEVLIALKTAIARHGRIHLAPSLDGGDDGATHRGDAYRLAFACFLASYFGEASPAPLRARSC